MLSLKEKARNNLAIVIGLLSLEEMYEIVPGRNGGQYLADTWYNYLSTAWGCRLDEFTTTKEQGVDTLTWREGGRIVCT